MDFRQIDKDLQVEFATKKINAEKTASENLSRANSSPVYKKLDALERQIVLDFSRCKTKNLSYKN